MSTIKHDYDYELIDRIGEEMEAEQAQTNLFRDDEAYYVWNNLSGSVGDPFPVSTLPEKYQRQLELRGYCPAFNRNYRDSRTVVKGICGILALASKVHLI